MAWEKCEREGGEWGIKKKNEGRGRRIDYEVKGYDENSGYS